MCSKSRILNFLTLLFFSWFFMSHALSQTASEQAVRIAVEKTSRIFSSGNIVVTVFTPPPNSSANRGAVIINHGGIGLPAERAAMKRLRYPAISKVFLDMGFTVLLPLRRGHGSSSGPWADEFYGNSARPDYIGGGYSAADDILATALYASSLPGIDKSRIFLVGQSLGGWASLAAIAKDESNLIAGVINFAGGIGYYREQLKGLEHPNLLIEGAGLYGAKSKVPSLWLYTSNDSRFSVETINSMFNAYFKENSLADLELFPAFGNDGHSLFGVGSHLWRETVKRWLERQVGLGVLAEMSVRIPACTESDC